MADPTLRFAWLALALAVGGPAAAQVNAPRAPIDAAAAAAAQPAPDARTPATPSITSRPSTASTPNAPATPETPSARGREPSGLALDPRGGTWGTPSIPEVGSGLESVVNSGAPLGRSKVPRKVCPPGLENREGNCVAPAAAILR